MKKVFYICASAVLACTLLCCGPKTTLGPDEYGLKPTLSINAGLDTLNIYQMDSLVKADKLPVYSKWNKSYFKDPETNEKWEYGVLVDTVSNTIYSVKANALLKTKYIVQKRKYSK